MALSLLQRTTGKTRVMAASVRIRFRCNHRWQRVALLFALGCGCTTAAALDLTLPGVNLGATSFEDGGGGVGTLLQWSASRFDADRTFDADGHRRDIDYDRTLWVHRLHYAYTSRKEWMSGNPGVEVIVPVLDMDLQLGGAALADSGIGNPSIGVYLQWNRKTWLDKPFSSRLAMAVSLPWGEYRAGAPLNLGADYFSVQPYYAFTLRPDEAWELSGRLMYLWNGTSDDPESRVAARFPEPVDNLQPGQALHYNLSVSYATAPRWRVGMGMYHLAQISADRINGQAQPDSKERILGVGPGVQWRRHPHRIVTNYYVETMARNRAAGDQWVLRYLYVF